METSLFVVYICSCCVWGILASNPSTAGTDFVVPAFFATYGDGIEYDDTPKLYISGLESSASINLTVPGQEDVGRLTFSVGEGCTIPVLLNCRLSPKIIGTQTSALHVVSSQPIAVRMHQDHLTPNMPTSFISLPTSMLGTDYYVVDPGNAASPTELIITAGESGASITVSPSSFVELDGTSYDEGDEFRINLQIFESLIVRSDGDLTGTSIISDNPVSVIVGDYCSPDMPADTICRQPHQLIPTNQWGQRYVVTSFLSSEDSMFQIFANTDQTTVRLLGAGSEVASDLNRGESSLEMARSGNVYIVESDRLVYVLHYARNGQSLTAIPADTQRVTGHTSVPVIVNGNRNPEAHLLIMSDCANRHGFKLDFEALPRSISILRSSDGTDCIIRSPIERGNHLIHHESPDARYSVAVHVTDDEMSYTYPVSLGPDSVEETNGPDNAPVQMLQSRSKGNSGVLLKWKPPTSWPGAPKGYRIHIKNARDPAFCQCRNIIIHNPRRTSYWLRNLSLGERYIVGVRPFGSRGSGHITMQVIRRPT